MLIISTETSELCACSQITVMCVFWARMWSCLSLCVYINSWHSTLWLRMQADLLCVYVWLAEDDVGRAPTLAHSVLIWCLAQRFCPYLMTRGRPCPFMMSENEEGGRRVRRVQSKASIRRTHASTSTSPQAWRRELALSLDLNQLMVCMSLCVRVFIESWCGRGYFGNPGPSPQSTSSPHKNE